MKFLALVLLVGVVVHVCSGFRQIACAGRIGSVSRFGASTSTRPSKLSSMGSDDLSRPADEDSPEYREYLKQLMNLQANRARSGHSAPSSGSSVSLKVLLLYTVVILFPIVCCIRWLWCFFNHVM